MIGRGDGHRVHVFVFEEFPQILMNLRLAASQPFDDLNGALGLRLIHVADGHHARIRQLAVVVQVIASAPAQADDPDTHLAVCRIVCGARGRRNQTGAQEKGSAFHNASRLTQSYIMNAMQLVVNDIETEYLHFCVVANADLRIERSAEGDIVILPRAGLETSLRNVELTASLYTWAKRDSRGKAFGPDVQYTLPNGAARSPKAS
jgi:hypothetical protein